MYMVLFTTETIGVGRTIVIDDNCSIVFRGLGLLIINKETKPMQGQIKKSAIC
jgi:hypothetical protein